MEINNQNNYFAVLTLKKQNFMKKLFLLSLSLLISILTFGQQIAKNYVLVEMSTSTGCYYCPGAEMGAQDLVDNGKNVAVIAYHHNSYGDTLYTSDGLARISYYGYNGTPDTYFNGGNNVLGGNHSSSLYSTFLPIYNNAIDELTSFSCNIDNFSSTNDLDFMTNITVEKVADYTGSNLKLFVVVTEDFDPYNWEGQSQLGFVERGMFPSASGTALDFSSATSISKEINFSVDPSWNLENSELIVFVQDMDSKEILQVEKSIMDLPSGTNNIILQKINTPVEGEVICGNNITPTIQIKNKGTEELTSVDFVVSVNGSEIDTCSWTGNLASLESTEITLDEVTFNPIANNELSIVAENPNGVTDDDTSNNLVTTNFNKSDETTTRIVLDMNPGAWAFQTSYALFNSEGTELYSGSDFTDNEQINEIFTLDIDECYYFEFYSSGDGFHTAEGYCKLTDNVGGEELINISGDFGQLFEYNFRTTTVANISDVNDENISIFPNPTSDIININFNDSKNCNLTIFRVDGSVVFKKEYSNIQNTNIDVSDFTQGIYFITITGDVNYSEKIIIEK